MTLFDKAPIQAAKSGDALARVAAMLDRHVVLAASLFLTLAIYIGLVPPVFPVDNQNTYLLSGLAGSGYGQLSADWMSTTTSPFLVFSWLVGGLNAIGLVPGTRGASVLLALVFALGCVTIFRSRDAGSAGGWGPLCLFVLLLSVVAIHDTFMLRGMAGQYVLGMYLQPSEFGVLMVLAVALFAAGRPISPHVCAALAGLFHQSYLLPGAFLVLAFASHQLLLGKRPRDAIIGCVTALAIVSPVLWYSYAQFAPSDAEAFRASRAIIAERRIPHHAIPAHWFDRSQVLNLLVIALGTGLAAFFNRRLAYVMTVAALLGVLSSLTAVLIGSNALYLLFPWRISAVLMPLATVAMVVGIVRILVDTRLGAIVSAVPARVVMVALTVTVAGMSFSDRLSSVELVEGGAAARLPQDRDAGYAALVGHVRSQAADDRLYLHNPLRFASFRIRSGMPVFVDVKSHPYRDDEVLEWWRRMSWAAELFDGRRSCDAALVAELEEQGVTHIIVDPAFDAVDADGLIACLRRAGRRAVLEGEFGRYGLIRLP